MEDKKLEIAVYGKGGIGKSTISANLSAALAMKGKKVIQIGCDPKHDSTRLLLGGASIPTVLDYLRDTPRDRTDISDVLKKGFCGIGCIEAGGPKPGVGCAGRGIISAFEFLEKNRVKDDYDLTVYDVLGDVVCGGFAVPIRREYSDAIFLVTSGEFMAIYAANNILRGIRNFDSDKHARVAGIIYNERSLSGEFDRVKRFSEAVHVPVVATVPRSEAFARAEEKKCTVMQLEGWEKEHQVFSSLAEHICSSLELYKAQPLSDEELERCVLNYPEGKKGLTVPVTETFKENEENKNPIPYDTNGAPVTQMSPPVRKPLYGCAFNGASTTAIHLTDAVIIAHSPRSCAFYTWQNISSTGRRNLFNRGILMPSAISPNFETTQIGPEEAVFGGTDKLREHVMRAVERKPGAVIVISSCVSGIIGDDVKSMEELSTDEVPVIVIPADGDINGDYMQGIEMCLHTLADRLIDMNAPVREKTVNLIGEIVVGNNTSLNYESIRKLLGSMGITIGCRFLGDATADEVRNLKSAPLNILAVDNADNRRLKAWLADEYGLEFFDRPLPVGMKETKEFLEDIGRYFGCEEAIEDIAAEEERAFAKRIEPLKATLKGKKLLMTTINTNTDWLIDAAEACGMDIRWIGCLNYLHQEDMKVTSRPERASMVEEITDWSIIDQRIRETSPDIIYSSFSSMLPEYPGILVDDTPLDTVVGFQSGIEILQRWALLSEKNMKGEWMDDRILFEKYFA